VKVTFWLLTVTPVATAVNSQKVTFTYSAEADGTYTLAVPSFTNYKEGGYTVYFKANADNHNEATGSFKVIINKAAAGIDLSGIKTKVEYTGEEIVFTGATSVATTAPVDEGAKLEYANNKQTKVGTYEIKVSYAGSLNYLPEEKTLTVEIEEAAAVPQVGDNGETSVVIEKDIDAEEAASEEGISISAAIDKLIKATEGSETTVADLKLNVGETTTIAFDIEALKQLAKNEDVKFSYSETKVEDIKDEKLKEQVKGAALVLQISLQGAKFDEGTATITTAFVYDAPTGKVGKVFYIDENGKKVDMKASFDREKGTVSFDTNHFSTYVVEYVLSGGTIAGIVIAVVVATAGIAAAVYFLLIRKKKDGTPAEGTASESAAE